MPRLTSAYSGGAGTDLYDVVAADGSTGRLATSSDAELTVGQVIDAPAAPAHLRAIEFNGHTIDYVLPSQH
ncbi:hypothetical protein [Tsukamurella hominis]|uniref:hypothetical protein n=1 Tax=Tsukamurella hominis TaxID=1970232 RepID=UPI0039EA43D2